MGCLLVNSPFDAYEPNEVELIRTAARTKTRIKTKNILVFAKLKVIIIKVLNRFNMYYWFVIHNYPFECGVCFNIKVTSLNIESKFVFCVRRLIS